MKKSYLLLLSLIACLSVIGNDTLYFRLSNPWNTVKDPNGQYLRKCVKEKDYYHVWDYNAKNSLVTESYYTDTNFSKKLFCHKYFNEAEGWLEQTRCYSNGRLDGYFVSYDSKGDTTDYDIYKEGTVIKSWSLHPEAEDSVAKALLAMEVEAEFPGGRQRWLDYLGDHLEYPSALKDKNIKGEVLVEFTINIQGKVENVRVVKGRDPLLDKEAIRVIQRSPKWKPAMQNGKKVPAYMNQTIIF